MRSYSQTRRWRSSEPQRGQKRPAANGALDPPAPQKKGDGAEHEALVSGFLTLVASRYASIQPISSAASWPSARAT